MSNKLKIEKVASGLGLTIGCYDNAIDSLTVKELSKVLVNIEYQADTVVSIKRKKHVIEIDIIDGEVDFSVLTKDEYINRYGDELFN